MENGLLHFPWMALYTGFKILPKRYFNWIEDGFSKVQGVKSYYKHTTKPPLQDTVLSEKDHYEF